MTKWEYSIMEISSQLSDVPDTLTKLGVEGWEAYQVIEQRYDVANKHYVCLVFMKREVTNAMLLGRAQEAEGKRLG